MGGRRYTYLCIASHKLSKLDRFLVCQNFMNTQPNSAVTAHPRLYSDHSPITLCNSNMNLKKHWAPIVERFKSKLSGWKAKQVSFGGRLTLVKSVLNNLPLYFFSLFKAPSCIIDRLEKIRRRFLWGGDDNNKKISWVSWSSIMAPKKNGGLGVGSLKARNIALLMKWWYKLHDDNHHIWKDVILACHNLRDKPLYQSCKSKMPGVWSNICKISKDISGLGFNFDNFFSFKVGNGKRIRFWKDHWIGDDILHVKFPSIFALEKQKDCCISDRVSSNGFTWNWSHGFDSQECIDDLRVMLHLISSFISSDASDNLACKVSNDGSYNVRYSRLLIDKKLTSSSQFIMPWIKWILIKVNCFVWKACRDRIPVAKGLADRGINVGSSFCKLCNVKVECSNHALIKCSRASEILGRIFVWCGISLPNVSSVADLLVFASKWGNCQKNRSKLVAIIQCSFWLIWKSRNDFVFNSIRKSHVATSGDIVATSFLWIKNRSKISLLELSSSSFMKD